ncbi:HEPN domain-containing protein [uncultured Pseudacidovorax sp.]|uniref:HEPN domain-containing protein n=1 Tax=uncultured Pseudacidovorax sp. TaxID=679313 RepID=UPI0025F7D333|nr:HEPN domain-containing protein [uncultured Pseudacidovorax sp.]
MSWTTKNTEARNSVDSSLKVVDDLLAYMTTSAGKPSAQERALFAAAVVFSYGIWESYIEDLAIELAEGLSQDISPSKVPAAVQDELAHSTPWELSVHPGWQKLWVNRVKAVAKGDGDKFGLNTANPKQSSALLKLVGLQDVFAPLPANIIPQHLSASTKTVSEAIVQLVRLRGQIVHSGAVPDTLKKTHAREWRQFVKDLSDKVDMACRAKCAILLA